MTFEQWIKASNLTYEAVARLIPCSSSYPHMLATGKASPSFRMACRIEAVTNGLVPRTNWFPVEEKQQIGEIPNIAQLLQISTSV